jgi:hypothetical protein
VATALAIATVSGCGLGAGHGTSDVTLNVTKNFGDARVGSVTEQHVPGSETVMRILQRSFHVTTRYGGGFVESIEGLSGGSSRRDWFYYVNGIQASLGAAGTGVHRGDQIWWDLHDWSATDTIPAVVGSFPEPFVHGAGGKRLPTTIACGDNVDAACQHVASVLGADGVPVSTELIGTGSGTDSLAIEVASWNELSDQLVGTVIEHGPSASGVYAKFAGPGGHSLQLLDPHGKVVQTLGAGAGLIAATAQGSAEPTWLVTGTDAAGVAAAAKAFSASRLRDHFALAVNGDTDLPVPLEGAS